MFERGKKRTGRRLCFGFLSRLSWSDRLLCQCSRAHSCLDWVKNKPQVHLSPATCTQRKTHCYVRVCALPSFSIWEPCLKSWTLEKTSFCTVTSELFTPLWPIIRQCALHKSNTEYFIPVNSQVGCCRFLFKCSFSSDRCTYVKNPHTCRKNTRLVHRLI